jgi:hypothetical protein
MHIRSVREGERQEVRDGQRGRDGEVVSQPRVGSFPQSRSRVGFHESSHIAHKLGHGSCDIAGLWWDVS